MPRTPQITSALLALAVAMLAARESEAIPSFARRYETTCRTCHDVHYPRLNAFGKRFRDTGYQFPEGAEEPARAKRSVEPGTLAERLSVFKEVPLALRGQVFGVVAADPDATQRPRYSNLITGYLLGGGSVFDDVSFFFSWTPFPNAMLHQARIGFHDVLSSVIGEGTLNIRAGQLFLLDFQQPNHRALAPLPPLTAPTIAIGDNRFRLDDATLGVQLQGRPLLGPFTYELAVVAGDPGDSAVDRDGWKDFFGRMTWTFFQDTDNELVPGVFGYVGRSDMVVDRGGVELTQRDDFWIAGVDLEVAVGPVQLFGMALIREDKDAIIEQRPVRAYGFAVEAMHGIGEDFGVSLRWDHTTSSDVGNLESSVLTPHFTWLIATNVLASIAWRQDLRDMKRSDGVVVVDVTF